jgi:DNA-binding XRE family transcriptional regulator
MLDILVLLEYYDAQKGGDHMACTLRQARRLAEKTQNETAKAIGVCEHTYRKIEKNPEIATIKQAYDLAAFFGLELDDISFCR